MAEGQSPLFERTSPYQRASGVLALIFAFIGVWQVYGYMNGTDKHAAYLGGLNWKSLIFNYHPIFMTSGMILCGMSAILTYRLLPLNKNSYTKPLHGLIHTAAIIFVILGLTCVVVGNNYPDYNDEHAHYGNLTSLHSFLGLGALALFVQNYFFGFLHFVLPESIIDAAHRKSYLPLHVFLGTASVVVAVLAVETGLMELMAEKGLCYYNLTGPDLNPAKNYHKLPGGCKIANGAGVTFLAALFLFLAAIYNFDGVTAPVRGKKGSAEEPLFKEHHEAFSYHT